MGRGRRRRDRAIGRWGVWVCTGVLIALIPVSIWERPGAMVMHSSSAYADRGVILRLSGAHFIFLYSSGRDPGRTVLAGEPAAATGFDFTYWSRWAVTEKRSTIRWLSPAWWIGGRAIRGAEISLIYPAMIGALWSWVLWRRMPKYPMGACQSCGYSLDGLDSDVCPECGERIDGEDHA